MTKDWVLGIVYWVVRCVRRVKVAIVFKVVEEVWYGLSGELGSSMSCSEVGVEWQWMRKRLIGE
jgi:hypothetical protein